MKRRVAVHRTSNFERSACGSQNTGMRSDEGPPPDERRHARTFQIQMPVMYVCMYACTDLPLSLSLAFRAQFRRNGLFYKFVFLSLSEIWVRPMH